jgi:hypothetical protein
MWTPTPEQRTAMAVASAALLVLVLASSFVVPAFFGIAPQFQLTTFAILASALSIGIAASRSRLQIACLPGVCGIIAIVTGEYLAFGYWVPAPHGAFSAPYTLQGSILILWGVMVCAVTFVFVLIGQRKAQAPSGLPWPAK